MKSRYCFEYVGLLYVSSNLSVGIFKLSKYPETGGVSSIFHFKINVGVYAVYCRFKVHKFVVGSLPDENQSSRYLSEFPPIHLWGGGPNLCSTCSDKMD